MTKEQFDRLPDGAMIVLIMDCNGKQIRRIEIFERRLWEYENLGHYYRQGNFDLEHMDLPQQYEVDHYLRLEQERHEKKMSRLADAFRKTRMIEWGD